MAGFEGLLRLCNHIIIIQNYEGSETALAAKLPQHCGKLSSLQVSRSSINVEKKHKTPG